MHANMAALREELEAMQQGMQTALHALDQGMTGLQDEVDDLALHAEADRKLVATIEGQALRAQQQLLQMTTAGPPALRTGDNSSGLAAYPVPSLHAISQDNSEAAQPSLAVSGNTHVISPAYGKQWPGGADMAYAQQSMRSVRRALAVITNASHIMAVGTPLQPSTEVGTGRLSLTGSVLCMSSLHENMDVLQGLTSLMHAIACTQQHTNMLLAAWQEDADTGAASLDHAVEGLQRAVYNGRVCHKQDWQGPAAPESPV